MPCLLLILWVVSSIALWVFAFRGFREASSEADPERRTMQLIAMLLAAGPPTLVFVVSVFVLVQAAPTAQFNAGSAWGMDLWSFWAHWWLPLYGCSGFQSVFYLLWLLGSLVTRTRRSVR